MQGSLVRLSTQKSQGSLSKGASRSTSIASSADDLNDEDQQSYSDENQNQQTLNNRKQKHKKERERNKEKDKDRETDKDKDKKPGWNTAAKSRIDTNMVKLKLLDATRKAVLDKTKKLVTSTGIQTDALKTKLCKDRLIDNQNDLINPKNKQTETDFDLITLKTKDGTVTVTASVAANTEKLVSHTVSTQTVMPRSNVSFKKFTDSRHKIQYADEDSEIDDDEEAELCLERIERRLKAKKKLLRQKSTQNSSNIEVVIEDDSSDIIGIETIPAEKPIKDKTSDSEYEDSIQGDNDDSVNKVKPKSKNSKDDATFNSWNYLNFEEQKVELPRNYFVENGPTPWSNFESLVLGQRFLNARLSPVPERISRPKVTWSDSQVKVVTDLMSEATALMDMFDQVAMLLGPDIKLHKISDVEEFELPPSKYNDELTKTCEKLEASLKRLQTPQYLPRDS